MQTHHSLTSLLQEIDALVDKRGQGDEFYSQFLALLMEVTDATQGCVWGRNRAGQAERLVAAGMSDKALTSRRTLERDRLIVTEVFQATNPIPDGVNVGSTSTRHELPPRFRLRLPLHIARERLACVTVDLYKPSTQQIENALALTTAATERLSKHYLQAHEERLEKELLQFRDSDSIVRNITRFIDLHPLGYEVVNRLQSYLTCDRVTLLIIRGDSCQTVAISNQVAFDQRAEVVRSLERLAGIVSRTQECLWYPEEQIPPPQLKQILESHFHVAHCLSIAVLPMFAQAERQRIDPDDLAATIRPASEREECIGVLCLEGIERGLDRSEIESRWERVRQPVSNAVAKARQYEGLFLMPVWRSLGRVADWYRGHTQRKALVITGIVLAALAALVVIPAEFKLRGEGVIRPIVQRHVFAESEGTIEQLLVQDGESVEQGELLAQLASPELDARRVELQGSLHEAEAQLQTILLQRVRKDFSSLQESRELVRQGANLETRIAGLREQLEVMNQQVAQLEVRSPIAGQVVTWDIETRLSQRPVAPGQRLLTVADLDQGWELELRIPDKRTGYLLEQWNQSPAQHEPLQVSFLLASHPRQTYYGNVLEVAPSSNVDDKEDDNIVRVRVGLDPDTIATIPDVRPGVTVIGHVHCGQESLGYCKLYEFFDWTRRTWFRYFN